MNKFLTLLEYLLKILKIFSNKNKKANINNENIQILKSGLESVSQTEEIIKAKKKIEYLETLSEKERKEKAKEILEIQNIVKKEVKANAIDDNRGRNIIKKYKEKRESK